MGLLGITYRAKCDICENTLPSATLEQLQAAGWHVTDENHEGPDGWTILCPKCFEKSLQELPRKTETISVKIANFAADGVRIYQEGSGFKVYVDGNEIRYITNLQLSFDVNEAVWKLTTTRLVMP